MARQVQTQTDSPGLYSLFKRTKRNGINYYHVDCVVASYVNMITNKIDQFVTRQVTHRCRMGLKCRPVKHSEMEREYLSVRLVSLFGCSTSGSDQTA